MLHDIWHGFWVMVGMELSALLVWLGWKFIHSKVAHRLHVDHWFHRIGDYFE